VRCELISIITHADQALKRASDIYEGYYVKVLQPHFTLHISWDVFARGRKKKHFWWFNPLMCWNIVFSQYCVCLCCCAFA